MGTTRWFARSHRKLTSLAIALAFAILLLPTPWAAKVKAWSFSFTAANAVRVMAVDSGAVAYDFSAVVLDPSWGYTALFHAEPYSKTSAGCGGDSIATRKSPYAYDPVYPDGFGTHSSGADLLVTRSMDSGQTSEYMSSPGCGYSGTTDTRSVSGAGNPILIYNGVNAWGLYWLSVRQEAAAFRHYLMLAIVDPMSMADLPTANMLVFRKDSYFSSACQVGTSSNAACHPGEDFTGYAATSTVPALVNKSLISARPVWRGSSVTSDLRVSSAADAPDPWLTFGLLGSMTFTGDMNSNQTAYVQPYFYYTDMVPVTGGYQYKLLRMEMNSYLTQFDASNNVLAITTMDKPGGGTTYSTYPVFDSSGNPTPSINTPLVRVNYHSTMGKYVILYNCQNATTYAPDICLQVKSDAALSGLTLGQFDSGTYGLHLDTDTALSALGATYLGHQFNIKKDGWGHHFGVDSNGKFEVVVYFPAAIGSDNVLGEDIYAKRVLITITP